MKYNVIAGNRPIILGRQGENEAFTVRFPIIDKLVDSTQFKKGHKL